VMGLEPTASSVTGKRSNQLSYTRMVSMGGIEPPSRAYESLVLTIELHRPYASIRQNTIVQIIAFWKIKRIILACLARDWSVQTSK
jgi:hypothetical protein